VIILVGAEADPHVRSVAEALSRDGFPFAIVDCLNASSTGLCCEISESLELQVGDHCLPINNIEAIWWRIKPKFVVPGGSVEDIYHYHFEAREWNHTWDYIGNLVDQTPSINNRRAAARANNKIFQLQQAKAYGFLTPRTLVTNNSERAAIFSRTLPDKRLIFKTLSAYMSPTGSLCYTTIVEESFLLKNSLQLALSPGIFQEFIEKEFELRITIVGSQIFAAKINTHASIETEVDWRERIFDDIYEEYVIPENFCAKLLELHKSFGLVYGAYDFAIGIDGIPVFLEVNPAGQWLWLERRLNLPISECIADSLIQHATGQKRKAT